MRVCPDSDLRALLFMDYFDKTAEEIRQGYPELTTRQELNGIFSSNGYQNSFLVRSAVDNMFTAAEMGWLHAVLFLVSSSVWLTSQSQLGENLLHVAARGNQYEVCRYLLLEGVDPSH